MKRLQSRALVVALLGGCAGDPRDALDEYAAALRARDAEQLWLLSDDAYRRAHDRSAVEAHLRAHPEEIDRLLRAIEGADAMRATIELGGGERLVLVKQADGWRVSFGGIEPFRADTPEAALSTFFRAARAGRLDAVRQVMPEEFLANYAEDAALEAHLSSVQERIESAQKALGPIRPNLAQIEGDRAWIAYAAGKRVELIREGDRWRVVDLE